MTFGYKCFYVLFYPIFRVIFHRIKVYGLENIPDGGVLICANHSHYSDPFILAYGIGCKKRMYYMAKKELFKIPVVGWFIKLVGAFPVDRNNSDITSIKTAIRHLKDGDKVIIFPEGHRVEAGDAVAAKGGAIMIASRTGVPIVPVYMPRKRPLFSTVRVYVGQAYQVPADRKTLNAKTYSIYAEELGEKIANLNPEVKAV